MDSFDSTSDRLDLAALRGAVNGTRQSHDAVGHVDGDARDRRGADLRSKLRFDLCSDLRVLRLSLQAFVGATRQREEEHPRDGHDRSRSHDALRVQTSNRCAMKKSTVYSRQSTV